MSENKESPFSKIFTQVAGAVLTALILYFIGININGEKTKPENATASTVNEEKKAENGNPEISKPKTTEKNNPSTQKPSVPEKTSFQNENVFPFTGTVVDKNGNTLVGIEVTWGEQKVKTLGDGTFKFNVPKSLQGKDIKIVLSKNGESYPPYENPSGTTLVFPPN